jgi:hypothetical protein
MGSRQARLAGRCLLLAALLLACAAENPNTYNVGGVLSNNDSATHFREIIEVRRQQPG